VEDDIAAVPDHHHRTRQLICGNRVVYQAIRAGNTDIYCYDLSTDIELRVTTDPAVQFNPAISGNTIVWEDYRDSPTTPEIWSYDFGTNVQKRLSPASQRAERPAISGRWVVWQGQHEGDGISYIYAYGLDHGNQFRVAPSNANQAYPAIDGPDVVWQDYRNGHWDVYYSRLYGEGLPANLSLGLASGTNPSISGNHVVFLKSSTTQFRHGTLRVLQTSKYGNQVVLGIKKPSCVSDSLKKPLSKLIG